MEALQPRAALAEKHEEPGEHGASIALSTRGRCGSRDEQQEALAAPRGHLALFTCIFMKASSELDPGRVTD